MIMQGKCQECLLLIDTKTIQSTYFIPVWLYLFVINHNKQDTFFFNHASVTLGCLYQLEMEVLDYYFVPDWHISTAFGAN